MHGSPKVYLTALSCLVLTLPLLADSSAETLEPESESLYVQLDALWLFRDDGGSDVALGEFRFDYAGTVDVVSTGRNDLDFKAEPGFRILVGRQIDPDLKVEGSYFGLHDWDDTRSIFAPAATYAGTSPFLGQEFDDSFTISAGSELHNFELNLLHDLNEFPADVLAGFRFIKFDDYLKLSADGIETTSFDTTNHAFGLQLGAQTAFSPIDFLTIQAGVKGGLLLNFANQETSNSGVPGLFARTDQSVDDLSLAAVVDVSIMAKVEVTENFFLRGGYQCFAVSGLAEADSQMKYARLSATRPAPLALTRDISTDNEVLFHGFFIGGELILP